jgi:cytoskeleton protein RodZ
MGVSVRHNSRLAALVATTAAVMTVAWFSRALQSESAVDWVWCVAMAAVALLQLLVIRDGRAPLMVADDHGVRVRHGRTWSGLRWQDIADVEVTSPTSWLRDGRIVVHPRMVSAEEPLLAQAAYDEYEGEFHGTAPGEMSVAEHSTEAYVVRLARTTRVEFEGLSGDLVADLDALSSGRVPVLVLTKIEPEKAPKEKAEKAPKPEKAPRPEKAPKEKAEKAPKAERAPKPQKTPKEKAPKAEKPEKLTSPLNLPGLFNLPRPEKSPELAEAERSERSEHTPREPGRWAAMFGSPAPSPTEGVEGLAPAKDLDEELEPERVPEAEVGPDERPAAVPHLIEQYDPVQPNREARPAARSEVLRDTVRMLPDSPALPAQRSDDNPVFVARVDEFAAPRPVEDALIGPLIAAARHRARLSIDVLSERTRIRPHVLECIEVDDFEACGGDFYARGHLRTLARVFGLDAQQLLDLYDDHYAKAEIEARQVFEAELATGIGGGVRAAHSGPRWSLLAACVLALACVWGVARFFNDTPQELVSPAPNVVDSAGLATKAEPEAAHKMTLAPLEVTAVGASPQVVVRDRDGRILWAGKLAEDQRQQVIGLAPFEVTSSNGSAVRVSFLGKRKGTVGEEQAAASRQFR